MKGIREMFFGNTKPMVILAPSLAIGLAEQTCGGTKI